MTEQLERKECWLVESANFILDAYLKENPNCCILETGCGASTIWFAPRCKELISIEHDMAWYDKVNGILLALQNQIVNIEIKLAERPYYGIIDGLQNEYFDIILIDGRDRNESIKRAIPKLKQGGLMIVDNSERPAYAEALSLMKDWNAVHCHQKQPDKYNFTYQDWTTSIFYKP